MERLSEGSLEFDDVFAGEFKEEGADVRVGKDGERHCESCWAKYARVKCWVSW